ncbi:GNAT family N-acetyltransferase [Nocardia sp. NBC_01730]|uniref:GNAT family N-acetyltransferase n=1 Tax=Nocardia sp. NBC_01730 TaxID=2975998 RepID=UPI002E10FCAD|nr:GNAT family N-acetyltransferase [Nocardia sp. NBC_01730]
MTVTIRPRTAADLDGCATALRKVHEVDGYPAQWPANPVGWLSPSKLIAARIAEQGGAVIGHVGIGAGGEMPPTVRDMAGSAEIASVIRFYVVPEARRAGVGSRLLSAGVRMAEMRGQRAALTVESDGAAAIALYERHGWRRVHSGPSGWRTADGREAWVHYYVSL